MAERTISGKRVVKTTPVEVSPISTLPPGLDEGQYRVAPVDEAESSDTTELTMPAPTEEGGYLLDVPQNVHIKEQILRFLPGGEIVVDIIVGFDEVKGATDYEVRYTRKGD